MDLQSSNIDQVWKKKGAEQEKYGLIFTPAAAQSNQSCSVVHWSASLEEVWWNKSVERERESVSLGSAFPDTLWTVDLSARSPPPRPPGFCRLVEITLSRFIIFQPASTGKKRSKKKRKKNLRLDTSVVLGNKMSQNGDVILPPPPLLGTDVESLSVYHSGWKPPAGKRCSEVKVVSAP